jgi:asparagine synthase (glutamine-hydrolysing)
LYNKKIIRDSFRNIPDFVLNRTKQGWFSPDNYYLKNNLKDFFLETFNKSELDKQNIFNYEAVIKLFKEHLSNIKYHKSELITLLAFQSWYNQVLKS